MIALVGVAAVLGMSIGSFLNVVIHRVPAGRSVMMPGSACPRCNSRVRPHDNIPVVSWLLLRGRCRDCGTRIPARYLFVELATGLVYAGVVAALLPAIASAPSPGMALAGVVELIALLIFAAVSIALSLIDLETHRLPNPIILFSYVVLTPLLAAAAIAGGDLEQAARAAAGAGIVFGAYLLLAALVPKGMGLGDVKLAGVVGLVLGYVGWAALAVGGLAAFLLGGMFGLLAIAAGKARRSTGIPFGPWMLGGAWLGILLGEPIAGWYLALFGLR